MDLDRDRIILPAGFVKAVEDQWLPLDAVLRQALESLPRHGKRVFCFRATDGHEIGDLALSHRVVALAKLGGRGIVYEVTAEGVRVPIRGQGASSGAPAPDAG